MVICFLYVNNLHVPPKISRLFHPKSSIWLSYLLDFLIWVSLPQTRLLSSFCRPSLLAELTSEHMNNPPVVTLSHLAMATLTDHGVHALLDMPLPCSLNLVNLRTMSVAHDLTSVKALMVMQHAGVDCNFSEVHMECEVKVRGDVFQVIRTGGPPCHSFLVSLISFFSFNWLELEVLFVTLSLFL